MEHGPVILFGVLHQPRVLLGEEEFVRRDAAVALRKIGGASLQFDQLRHHLVLARIGDADARRVTVRLRILAEVLEA